MIENVLLIWEFRIVNPGFIRMIRVVSNRYFLNIRFTEVI